MDDDAKLTVRSQAQGLRICRNVELTASGRRGRSEGMLPLNDTRCSWLLVGPRQSFGVCRGVAAAVVPRRVRSD